MKRTVTLTLAVAGAFLAGIMPTSASSNPWFRWPGKPRIALKIRVPEPNLLPSFERAVEAWSPTPVFKLTIVDRQQCPAKRQVSVCIDRDGQQTSGNPAATQPTLVNNRGASATIWVYEPWAATASQAELDYMACHELGHALGLAHQAVADSCMSYAFARPFPNSDDFRTLGEMYGLPASTDPSVAGFTEPVAAPAPAPAAAANAQARPSAQICAPALAAARDPAADVEALGDAGFFGSTGDVALSRPIVGMAATPSGAGYWTIASDGGIFAFGDARFYGSTGNLRLNQPIVGIARTPKGRGYWMVASDGGIFAYGDARFYGSTGNLRLSRPIVGMAPTSSGNGYWLVASDGGIFAFGDARFYGSTGNLRLNQPIVAMAPTPTGSGYWMYASDGGIFNFGDAPILGSGSGLGLGPSVTGVAATPAGDGYWMVGSSGTVAAFGHARCFGSLNPALDASRAQAQAIVPTPSGGGYWVATTRR